MSIKHFHVEQLANESNVSSELIYKLYNICKNQDKGNLFTEFDNSSVMAGNINTAFTYREFVTKIKEYFPNLNITPSGYYIMFEDNNTRDELVRLFSSDGIGISETEAPNIAFTNKLCNNQVIGKFNEFKYFTANNNVTYLFQNSTITEVTMPPIVITYDQNHGDRSPFCVCHNLTKVNWNNCVIGNANQYNGNSLRKYFGLFNGCESLTWNDGAILPPNCTEFSDAMFTNCKELEKIIMPEGVTAMGEQFGLVKCQYIEISSTCESLNFTNWLRNVRGTGAVYTKVMALKPTTPPTITSISGYHDANMVIYVPDESISLYQNHEIWGTWSIIKSIHPLSELPDVYREMGTIGNGE